MTLSKKIKHIQKYQTSFK